MMEREFLFLATELGILVEKCISRSQLGRLLELLDFHSYNELNERHFGVKLNLGNDEEDTVWYAIDGKRLQAKLRGSIDKASGQKRAENIIRMVARMVNHIDSSSRTICYYDGSKISEKKLVKQYFNGKRLLKDAYSFDALHTDRELLSAVHRGEDTYLAQVKYNQKYLLEDCMDIHCSEVPDWMDEICEKGHGRIEKRKGYHYHVAPDLFASSWKSSGLSDLMVVEKERYEVKTGKRSLETSFAAASYISNRSSRKNGKDKNIGKELFDTVRGHWRIESDHFIRDEGFGEDRIRCFNKWRARALAAIINVAVNLIRRNNDMQSITVFREKMNYDRRLALKCLK
ncbi:ISAs1 family transposase [Chondrinema litorale]|uniref:ISAs1 family transposase n=1 Tax=Chondrinema litorale TaxID=2994555 RepID=UPI002542AF20|nr:ISAs1 family transposase [Chondrinema litorale]UZR99969.1 ISAs1 family transposase [Chondrinema litorale]